MTAAILGKLACRNAIQGEFKEGWEMKLKTKGAGIEEEIEKDILIFNDIILIVFQVINWEQFMTVPRSAGLS